MEGCNQQFIAFVCCSFLLVLHHRSSMGWSLSQKFCSSMDFYRLQWIPAPSPGAPPISASLTLTFSLLFLTLCFSLLLLTIFFKFLLILFSQSHHQPGWQGLLYPVVESDTTVCVYHRGSLWPPLTAKTLSYKRNGVFAKDLTGGPDSINH